MERLVSDLLKLARLDAGQETLERVTCHLESLFNGVEASGTGTQSAGTTQWIATNLDPGYYVIVCFVQDPTKDYIPHAFEGMVDVYTVGDVGTPTP